MGRLRRFLPPQVADLIVASGTEKQLESHRREITALFCDLRGFTGFSESSDPEDVMALLRDYHAAIGETIIKYSGTLERYAGDGVMVVFNDPVPVEKPALQAVLMALEMRDVIGALTEKWRRLGHDIGFGIGIAHGFATLGTIGFEGRFDYAAIGTVSNVASRLCDEAKPGQILISPRVFMAVEDAVTVEPVGEFALKGIRRPSGGLQCARRGIIRTLRRTTMDLGSWLRSLGLERYEGAFRENDIDETVLPNLTAEDLKELGVASLGHRRKLLDAIAALKAPPADAAPPSSAPSVSPEDRAERRQVTVMFSDLVGSTALSARIDPEDLREVISAYQKCVAETVRRFGGFVAKYMGDGVLVYFGYPQAHEDDAERAVRAGLELIAAVTGLKTRASLQTRVGIATGLVVVGDLIGSGEAQERGIVGETPNLAARLQGVAEPNAVVIAESTRKLVGNLFELNDLGAQDLKGIAEPVRAWAALRQASVEGRFEAFHASGLTELVGRQEELDLLLRRWSKVMNSEGQVVLLSGEAGIGKSRLIAALSERLATEPQVRLRYFCSPQHTDSALYPIISQMERAAGFALGDAAQAKLDKLDAVLARSYTPPQDGVLLAELLSLPNDGRYPTLDLIPQQRRQRTLEA